LEPQNFLEEIMKNIFKKLLVIAPFFFGLFLCSCEDDALLAPQTGDADDGGSYGNLSFPTDPKKNKTLNPETF
tara:strand:+ start:203 stop:421 length:219 start_codon:yes stop_codon:yes gene_type:complete